MDKSAKQLRRAIERLDERIGHLMSQRAEMEAELSYAQRRENAESAARLLGVEG